MVVVLNCLSSGSGGAMSYLRNVLPRLAERFLADTAGHTLVVLGHARHLDAIAMDARIRRICPTQRDLQGVARVLWEARFLRRTCRELGADVLFVPYQVTVPVPRVKTVLMLRNMEPFVYRRYAYTLRAALRNRALALLSPACLRRATRVIAVSPYVEEFARDVLGVAAQRLHCIVHGRDLAFVPQAAPGDAAVLADLADRPYALACGSLLPYRRLEDVIAAWQKLAQAGRPPRLVVAGSSEEQPYVRMLRSAVQAAGLADDVRFLGQVPAASLPALYRAARVVVISSEAEACPNVAIEAMASGCAIVSADIPALRSIIGDGAAYYPPRDIGALAAAVARLTGDGAPSQDLRQSALRSAANYDWDLTTERTYRALTRWD